MARFEKYLFSAFAVTLSLATLVGCNSTVEIAHNDVDKNGRFVEVITDFKREDKNLRQWDAPVVADLDQDGQPDMLLNDHGFAIRVMWNDNGAYSKPYDLLMGDAHGISVGDFDRDGLNEIILARGGGSGSNARNSKIFRVNKQREFTEVPDFDSPLANMRGRTVKFVDLNNDGHLDLLNFAFPDKALKGKSENYIYRNEGNGQLSLAGKLPAIKADGQKTLVTDYNNDGFVDILLYGHGPVILYQGNGDFTFTDVSAKVLPKDINHVTSVAEIDFDSDGDFDLFFTRGKEFNAGDTFFDKKTNVWGFFAKRGAFKFDKLLMEDIFELENFQSQWPHKNIYIGESAYKFEYPGETHSGRNVRLVNSDGLGFPDAFDKKGFYVGYIGNQQWQVAANIFSPMTGIVKGVKSFPETDAERGLNDLLLENNRGEFKDVTIVSNVTSRVHSMGSAIGDFNNDGYTDIAIVPRGNLVTPIKSILYLNQRGVGFVKAEMHNIVTPELGSIGMSAQAVDYNLDGKLDLVTGNDRGKWHLFRNQLAKPSHNSLTVLVEGNSGVSSLGAIVSLRACGNLQTLRVGATSAMYSLNANANVHFGLGSCTEIEQLKVTWSDQSARVVPSDTIELNQVLNVGIK